MKDTDLMPYGKFSGTAMANVPAWYLLWLHREFGHLHAVSPEQDKVHAYIEDNLDVLKEE